MSHVYANRYEKIRDLGKGSSGRVILTHDTKTGLLCALKILRTSFGRVDGAVLDCFRREFQILKECNHPSIARVFDAGYDAIDNYFYMTTQYVDGKDLFEATENFCIEQTELLFIQALRAFNYLHSQNIFHLDVKPQNMLVSFDQNGIPQLKVIDFGLANLGSAMPASFMGTAAYVAPEIIQAQPYDGRTDLYSLGCAFYKAFTRQLPFGGNEEEVCQKHLVKIPQKLSSINSNVADYLDLIFAKLLQKDPAKRYTTAAHVIEDFNLLAEKNYSIETKETIGSYLPETGSLICRDYELEKFDRYFEDRILACHGKLKPYLIVHGMPGTGKSRFLHECKNRAAKHFISILSWSELDTLTIGQVSFPCLVLGDSVPLTRYDLEYLEAGFAGESFLALITTDEAPCFIDSDAMIELGNFTQPQTEQYLQKATGIKKIPATVTETIYHRTGGNPLYMTEYTRSLFEKGFFRDSHGSWSERIIEDLGAEIKTVGATDFIKNRLSEQLKKISLTTSQTDLLNVMALTETNPWQDLAEMTDGASIENDLQILVDAGILEMDVSHHYGFTNPLYKELIIQNMSATEMADYCDYLAHYFESDNNKSLLVHYYRGRGNSTEAIKSLFTLVQKNREQGDHDQARINLDVLLNKKNLPLKDYCLALLEMGQIEIEAGKFAAAKTYLLMAQKIYHANTLTKDVVFLKILEHLGICENRQQNFSEADKYYNEGLTYLHTIKSVDWMKIVFMNRLAQNALQQGNADKAYTLFNEAWNLWKQDLNDSEKLESIRSDIDTIFYLKGEYEKAANCLEEIRQFLAARNHPDIYPVILAKLGRVYLQMGKANESEQLLTECLDLMKNRHSPYWLHAVYNELGKIHETRGSLNQALDYFKHAMDLARKNTSSPHAFFIAYNMAIIYLKQDKLDEAKKYLEYAVRNLRNLFDKQEEIQTVSVFFSTLLALVEVYRKLKDYPKAIRFLQEAENLLKTRDYLAPQRRYYQEEKADLEKTMATNE